MALSDFVLQQQYGVAPTATTGMPATTAPSYQANLPSGVGMVQSSLEAMLNPNSSYIQNARQRGAEYAASRGGINSSIAAGASERAAIEAAAPLAQQAVAIESTREQVAAEDWLSGQNFNRSLQGQLTMMPLTNSFNMLNAVQQYALEDPALYTPEVISGYSNFFQKNMDDIMNTYFSSLNIGG